MNRTRKTIIWVAIAVVVVFIVGALLRSAPRPAPAQPVDIDSAPARVYGRIEPLGGEVFVAPPSTRTVVAVAVAPGDAVAAGQELCRLELSVEARALEAAQARVEAARRARELSGDTFARDSGLFANKGISEYEYNQSRLRAELDSVSLVAAGRDAALARAQFDQLVLRAPVAGRVYKFDVRLGQTLAAGDNTSIILGAPGFQARLYVESYWADRLKVGTRLRLLDAETLTEVGRATVANKAPYLGTRAARTEDNRVRIDVDVQEVVAPLDSSGRELPLGLYVLAERAE
jgi:multidrug efflux pump subunit AcrA (membrane-fusion protein)